ncbi:hypothetical protein [Dysgonomonas macrotermitis]|uniref:Uncharacterized protein n=1 Tax=Dysgonomonas macrotermitis TaxID=1346286 RepID=A0A1M5J5D0_9BACT|nr:hypothetical protein [Dysgonomonas macrotermitis]SHG35721.1 hypothetical protein SAMN05444362_12212 [Dysgonomonas macrotermitis]
MKKKILLLTGLLPVCLSAQVGINTQTPDISSVFDAVSSDKGILIPRVVLTSSTMDLDQVSGQPAGLMVFNSGGALAQGFYYWNGQEWRILTNATSVAPLIGDLLCTGATLNPASYQAGMAYSGVMKVSYTGGNGGFYSGGSTFTSHGLTFTLQEGQLENGSGDLLFIVQGTPDISTPEGITIPINGSSSPKLDINFWSGNCQIKVGDQANADIKTIATMNYMAFITDADTGAKGFSVQCNTPDGLYTLRVFLRHSNQTSAATASNNTESVASGSNNNVQIRNNSTVQKTLMWNYSTFYGGQITDAGGNLQVPSHIFGGGQGNTWTSNSTTAYAPWGNAGIYNGNNSGPEYRYYSWIDTSTSTKVAYIATIMAGIDPGATLTDATKQKVFIKIEQITSM